MLRLRAQSTVMLVPPPPHKGCLLVRLTVVFDYIKEAMPSSEPAGLGSDGPTAHTRNHSGRDWDGIIYSFRGKGGYQIPTKPFGASFGNYFRLNSSIFYTVSPTFL